jgi:hypothetical protein
MVWKKKSFFEVFEKNRQIQTKSGDVWFLSSILIPTKTLFFW